MCLSDDDGWKSVNSGFIEILWLKIIERMCLWTTRERVANGGSGVFLPQLSPVCKISVLVCVNICTTVLKDRQWMLCVALWHGQPTPPTPRSKMCVKWVLIVILFTRNYRTATPELLELAQATHLSFSFSHQHPAPVNLINIKWSHGISLWSSLSRIYHYPSASVVVV